MFRIRKINDVLTPGNRQALDQVRDILSLQFPDLGQKKIDQFIEQLSDPFKYRFISILFVADDPHGQVKGFALMMYAIDLNFCFLDFIASKPGKSSGGIGGALYQRLGEEAALLGSKGLFFECLPDDPELCPDKTYLDQNARRLAFYERFGARPIMGTLYETPVKEGDDCPPYLMAELPDGLNLPSGGEMVKIVQAILERKYGDYCPPEYISRVSASFNSGAFLRSFKYQPESRVKSSLVITDGRQKVFLCINDRHAIHHVREIGYVESPVRIESIKKELAKTDWFSEHPVKHYPLIWIEKVHDKGYIGYFKKVCENLAPGKSVYPYVFPIRNNARPPKELSVRAGYYCFDTFTPLNRNAYDAARRAVDCTLTAADAILQGTRIAYALIRPPGHHAEKKVFGGFCYFNNNAIAADYLSRFGKVAILDVDYHHGNGQQIIFYNRSDVLTISIHGHPSFAYPYFSGFKDEKGDRDGYGFNMNYPLDENIEPEEYFQVLREAVEKIRKFNPANLIIALGLDTAKDDPTGTWKLTAKDFVMNGRIISALNLPTLVVQEGGYRTQQLGINARSFFKGLCGKE